MTISRLNMCVPSMTSSRVDFLSLQTDAVQPPVGGASKHRSGAGRVAGNATLRPCRWSLSGRSRSSRILKDWLNGLGSPAACILKCWNSHRSLDRRRARASVYDLSDSAGARRGIGACPSMRYLDGDAFICLYTARQRAPNIANPSVCKYGNANGLCALEIHSRLWTGVYALFTRELASPQTLAVFAPLSCSTMYAFANVYLNTYS